MEGKDQVEGCLKDQVSHWNNGDIKGYMSFYKNDPETFYVGRSITKGFDNIAEKYESNYVQGNRMGKLSVTELSIRLIENNHAIAIGRWHLERDQESGGPASGIFSLVWEKTSDDPTSWRVILDHAS
eukprot:TRINITY_DN3713_c0_g1_i1.p1 TRINITY_DN3713_c0_g1~~TRINITY_DN3713_c0_g1_i1.p1  ORF type:complete len:127 (+),score=29.12 TRINITY_DN3713_c0_g1_i1:3-383(+)